MKTCSQPYKLTDTHVLNNYIIPNKTTSRTTTFFFVELQFTFNYYVIVYFE